MMKKIAIAALIVTIVALIVTFAYFKGRRYEVVITQQQIDAVLADKFPVSKRYLLIIEITYSDPAVTLLPDSDRVRIGMKAELNLKFDNQAQKVGGTCLIASAVRYKPDTQQFFLSDPKIERLEIQGLAPALADRVAKAALSLSSEHLQSFPIHTLRATDLKTSAAKLLLKDVQVKDGGLHLTLGL